MRGRAIWVGVLTLVALTGCPEDYGIGGTMDRAVHKDVMDAFQKRCTKEKYEKYCKDVQSRDCIETCG